MGAGRINLFCKDLTMDARSPYMLSLCLVDLLHRQKRVWQQIR